MDWDLKIFEFWILQFTGKYKVGGGAVRNKSVKFIIFLDWVFPIHKTFDLGLKLPFYLLFGWWVVGGVPMIITSA